MGMPDAICLKCGGDVHTTGDEATITTPEGVTLYEHHSPPNETTDEPCRGWAVGIANYRPRPVDMTAWYRIPGNFAAEFDKDGNVSRLTFTPHAGDAGYFGPSAYLVEGYEFPDIEDTDGPFWFAMQHALLSNALPIEWTE